MLMPRPFWVDRIETLWRTRSIVWLAGARRLGKTVLGRHVPEAQVFNCDLPSVRERLADPELFFGSLAADRRIVLDEVHRAEDPSGLLKIGADEHPGIRILATGSSTLHASARFRDSLAGRKWPLRLAPVLWRECPDWLGAADLDRRLFHGGFPEPLLAATPDPQWFEEWIDSFFARDVHALFGTRNRTGFLRAASLAFARNGELLDITSLARDAGVSRPTAVNYLDLLDACQVTVRLPPFHGGGRREMVRRPRLYALDTGLVCHVRGWTGLRPADRGPLWENLVLDELLTAVPRRALHYWRDAAGHEVDFAVVTGRGRVAAVEAKVSPQAFAPKPLRAFRAAYPDGPNLLCCPLAAEPYPKRFAELTVTVCAPVHAGALIGSGTLDREA